MVNAYDDKEGVLMHISSGKPSGAQRFAHTLYLAVAGLILIGIVSEGLLIGPSLFSGTTWGRAVHGHLAGLLLLLTLLLPVVGRFSRLPGRMILLSVVLFVLTLSEAILAVLGRRAAVPAALHPATALLMSGLTVMLLLQGWRLLRERSAHLKF
jgi:hypothetical protein